VLPDAGDQSKVQEVQRTLATKVTFYQHASVVIIQSPRLTPLILPSSRKGKQAHTELRV